MSLVIKENIYSRINKDKNSFKLFFNESNKDFGARYCVIDNLLPLSLANEIAENFPDYKKMRYLRLCPRIEKFFFCHYAYYH
jgi:hypothetical protein